MRDLLLMAIIGVVAIMALGRPWIGVMLWNWISIMNPHRYTWGFAASAPVAMIAGLVTLIGLLFTKERGSPFKGAPVWWLLLFVIWMTISWLAGVDVGNDYNDWNRSIKIYLMIFVALSLLSNKYHILAFVWVTAGSLALLGAKGGLFTVLTGGSYRVWGPPDSFIDGNNEMALALITIIPLLHFLQLQLTRGWQRHAMSGVMVLCAAAALGSHSRGALLALIAMGAMFWWRSKSKGSMTILIMVTMLALLPMMPEEWWSRMETIETYEEDASANQRINAWTVAWHVAGERLTGGGMSYQYQDYFSRYGVYDTQPRAAHSIYFQILGNHGFIGLGIFLSLWLSTYLTAGWVRKHGREIAEAHWASDLGGMIQVGLVGFLVGGAFLSLAYFDLPYNMMVMAVLAKLWITKKGWERDPHISFIEFTGISSPTKAVKSKGK
ncbi:putative O-glycosylation ligase, exosortase A system-associated [Allochromatium vinosum]|uniref:putative O-glycosylation ligase, exosortase A system-associated n=1 Tax=Allochromatium vinosum TaxID=1049 RepID=UPI001905C835|nr:putative O-glycosylation ligase, exosortase A system-associated [Allochromatium vinosum]MBK1656440.1 putative O-glycosylation ligase, exosortase A system-associated [Allochromatium vinosum]